MSEKVFPSVFVAHGAPTLPFERGEANRFLRELGPALGRPRAVVCVSAHWETRGAFAVSAAERPETIHDFGGFVPELYALRYPVPGAPEVAARAAALLAEAGLGCDVSPDRGLDHGAWVPLLLMYPEADVPVCQLSVQPARGPAAHLELGRALAPLRGEGVLILGAGGVVHNLRRVSFGGGETPAWAARFDEWVYQKVTGGEYDELADYRSLSAEGEEAHPTEEHFLPLLVAAGAGGEGARGTCLHRSFSHGSLSMAAYSFV